MPWTASSLFSLATSLQQFFRRCGRVEAVQLAFDADRLACAALVAHVHFAGRIVAHQHGRQARHDAVVLDELDNLLGKLRANLLGQLLAVENSGGHVESRVERQESRAKHDAIPSALSARVRSARFYRCSDAGVSRR